MKTHKLLPSETVLEDNYPIYENYIYIFDGIVLKSNQHSNVKDMKALFGYKEIRRCELFGHEGACLGDKFE